MTIIIEERLNRHLKSANVCCRRKLLALAHDMVGVCNMSYMERYRELKDVKEKIRNDQNQIEKLI